MYKKELIFDILGDLDITGTYKEDKFRDYIEFTYKGEKCKISYEIRKVNEYSVFKKEFYSLNIDGYQRGVGCPQQEEFTKKEIKETIKNFIKYENAQMTIFDLLEV